MYSASPEALSIGKQIDSSPKPVVVMGIGIPASGKSTLLEQTAWLAGPDLVVVNVDNIRNRFLRLRAGRRLAEYIDQEMYRQIEISLDNFGVAVVDTTNTEHQRRIQEVGRYRDLGAAAVGAVFLDTPKDLALERNTKRPVPVTRTCIEQMDSSLQSMRPDLSEGYNWLITVKPHELTVESNV